MFVENTAPFLNDFGTLASFIPPAGSWTFDGVAPKFDSVIYTFDGATTYKALVIFDQPDKDVLGDRAISADYTIEYRTLDLPGLVLGAQITVGGNLYSVIDTMAIDDGTFSRARLEI